MLFNSYIFVLLFLPLTIIGYFALNRLKTSTASHVFLLAMSLWFYGYFNIRYLPIIIISIIVNFAFYKILKSLQNKSKAKRLIVLWIALVLNIGVLVYFKHFDFFLTNVNLVFGTNFNLLNIVLPLGISFFTFQQVSFVVDAYKNEVPDYNFLNYALFVTYFPQLIAGPIVTHDELVPQFADESKRHLNFDNFSKGLYIFALGMAKKVLIADTFGNAVNYGFSNIDGLDSISAFIVMLAYTIQIYFDFSGYCDMAIGIAKMMNIDLPLNFNSPYKALTINEFWDRWHMTLTRFFTRYVYIPLGGNRKGKARTYINMFIVFFISGLWHGSNWTFILWGIMHGVFSIITRCFKKSFDKLHPALNWLITFGFVNVAWVFFRADSIRDAASLIGKIISLDIKGIDSTIVSCFNLPEFEFLSDVTTKFINKYSYIFFVLFFIVAFILILGSKNAYEKMHKFKPTIIRSLITVFLIIWCIFSFSGVTTFLYFNF